MNIYDFLHSHQRKTPFEASPEMAYFRRNAHLLSNVEAWEPWINPRTPFDVVRANILIRSLVNKQEIEKLYFAYERKMKEGEDALPLSEYMDSRMSDFPYLLFRGEKVYVPFFPSSLNLLYARRYEKLSVAPYRRLIKNFEAALVDPFDYYGNALFDSYFTRLVPIERSKGVLFAYDYDAENCYAINDQGRLDATISLFDGYLLSPSKAHMAERLLRLAEAYFGEDSGRFYSTLVSEKLVSGRLIQEYLSLREVERIKEDRRDG